MPKINKISEISKIVLPIVENHGCELVDVEFIKEGSAWFLRIYIDKPGGVFIDDCQVVSEDVSDKLDELDPIEQSYYLEVSSPGLERPLKKDSDYQKCIGEKIELKLYTELNGKKVFQGILVGVADDKIIVEIGGGVLLEVEKDKTAYVKRAVF